jgi:hypothetical protein
MKHPTTDELLKGLRGKGRSPRNPESRLVRSRPKLAKAIAEWIARENLTKAEAAKRLGMSDLHVIFFMGTAPACVPLSADSLFCAWQRIGGTYLVQMRARKVEDRIQYIPPPPTGSTKQ